jgi:exodeoxyribonuclease V gamma subunit
MRQSGTIQIYFSNTIEVLTQRLAATLHDEQSNSQDIFQESKVLVPNNNVERYLQISLAEYNQSAINIEFPFLEHGLWELLTVLSTGNSAIERLDTNRLSQMIIHLMLDNSFINDPVYKPFREYLLEDGKIHRSKLWQLCRRLAGRFQDYEMHRPGMVKNWLEGQAYFTDKNDTALQQLENAQRHLYCRIFAEQDLRNLDGREYLTLFQLAERVYNSAKHPDIDIQQLHIFAPSRLSIRHRQIICQLGRYLPVNIYHLNICTEFWEDITTPGEDRWLEYFKNLNIEQQSETIPTEELIDPEYENQLLKAWGKPGREMLKIYSDLEEDAAYFNVRFGNYDITTNNLAVKAQDSLLHRIQYDISMRQSGNDTKLDQPQMLRSLQIAGAPSIRREVEAVYNSILYNMTENPELQLSDIAVLVTDMQIYQPVLRRIFEADGVHNQRPVPYSLIDSNASVESLYARGIDTLFTIIEEDFIRRDIFELFRNPCFQEACGCSSSDVDDWLDIVEQLGIFRGYDKLYDAEEYQHLFTWEQGLKRLRFGSITDGLDEIDGVVPHFNSDPQTAGCLSWIIERLHHFRSRIVETGTAGKNIDEWNETINEFLDEFLAVPDDYRQEAIVQRSIRNAFDSLAVLKAYHDNLTYEDIKEFLKAGIADIPAGRGRYLGNGAVLASLQPMRPIPFKIIYILGLDEHAFPGQPENDAMDLKLRERKIGDISQIESMNYLFMETLICAREKLYLSYVERDIRKDRDIMPSPVIRELLNYTAKVIDPTLLKKSQGRELQPVCHLPLSSTEPESFVMTNTSPYDFHLNYSFNDWLLALLEADREQFITMSDVPHAIAKYKKQQFASLKAALQPHEPTSNEPLNYSINRLPTTTSIELKELGNFLNNPINALLKRNEITTNNSDTPALVTDEPFQLEPLLRYNLTTDALKTLFTEQAGNVDKVVPLTCLLKKSYREKLRRSLAPIPLFANLNNEKNRNDLEKIANEITPLLEQILQGPVIFGKADKLERVPCLQLPELKLQLDSGVEVILSGVCDYMLQDKSGRLSGILTLTSSTSGSAPTKHVLQPFLFWCCLCALLPEDKISDKFTLYTVYRNKVSARKCCRKFSSEPDKSVTINEVRNYLADIVHDYLETAPDYMPFKVYNELKLPPRKLTTEEDEIYLTNFTDKAQKALDDEKYARLLKILHLQIPPHNVLKKYQRRMDLFTLLTS